MNNEENKKEVCTEIRTVAEPKKKKHFEKPTIELIRFDGSDVVATSGGIIPNWFSCNSSIWGNYQPSFDAGGCTWEATVDSDSSGLTQR